MAPIISSKGRMISVHDNDDWGTGGLGVTVLLGSLSSARSFHSLRAEPLTQKYLHLQSNIPMQKEPMAPIDWLIYALSKSVSDLY